MDFFICRSSEPLSHKVNFEQWLHIKTNPSTTVVRQIVPWMHHDVTDIFWSLCSLTHTHTHTQLRWQQLQQYVWLPIGPWRYWGEFVESRGSYFYPRSTLSAVPTSPVCPPSGIAGLSEHSPSPRLCCFTFHCVSSRLLRPPRPGPFVLFDRWLWELFGYELWNYFR